jgi:pyridoxal phosphate enzyme (YggS family)
VTDGASGSIRERLHAVEERIAVAARAAGRDPASVRLIAVSKTKPCAAIREAYAAGQRVFGESYAQELVEKASQLTELADLPGIEWHFIGHLQSNKAKHVIRVAHTVHTVDTVALAHELGKRATASGVRCNALVEVNVGREAQKFGVAPEDVEEVLRAVEAEPGLALRGLMTVPPDGGREVARRIFDTLATLRTVHGGPGRLPELSMGMSADLEEAIAAGATLVRVGTAIFGERGGGGGRPA